MDTSLLLWLLSELYLNVEHKASFLGDNKNLNLEYFRAHNIIISKTYQYIGYWDAKVLEMTRNKKNVSIKSKSVEKNIEIVAKLLEENDFQIDRKLELKAMEAIDRGQRTVKNMIKEIMIKTGKNIDIS